MNLIDILTHIIVSAVIFASLFLILLNLKRNIGQSQFNAKFSISKAIYYVLLNEYIILIAWRDFFLRKENVLWEKAESTRT
jgi:uncharacterized membrane protein YozB (DUF420 family)